jgi:hypothetical protein
MLLICGVLVVLGAATATGERLPQEHAYQKVLRGYLAGLTVEEFTIDKQKWEEGDFLPAESEDELYRLWLLSQMMPSVRHLSVPAGRFTLEAIERDDGVHLPYEPGQTSSFYWLPAWEHAGNPYAGSKALIRRAFVICAIDAMMLDARLEGSQAVDWDLYGLQRGRRLHREKRSNSLSGTLIWLAHTRCSAADLLPEEVLEAYDHVLGKFVRRIRDWGPTGYNCNMDLFAAVSLGYVIRCIDDPELNGIARDYIELLYTDPRYFDPAGYTVEIQGYDASYTGISLYKHTYGALMRDWEFEREALAKAYRLKSHMTLPEPDGQNRFGPTNFSTRTSADSAHDQWRWSPRDRGAAMIAEEALYLSPPPEPERMEGGVRRMVRRLNAGLEVKKLPAAKPWVQRHWTRAVNFAYDFYVEGTYPRLVRLEKEDSPLLELPVEREDRFVRRFDDDFVVARFPGYYAILHTGPVGESKEDWPPYMPTRNEAYWGLSGGSLAAFWTPDAGSVLLGRRGGYLSNNPDFHENWRSWATHAVSGRTEEGRMFSSARTLQPEVNIEVGDDEARVTLGGTIPRWYAGYGDSLQGTIAYRRTFAFDADGVQVKTSVQSDGTDELAELYETLPVFLRDVRRQPEVDPSRIDFRTPEGWQEGGAEPTAQVGAVRIRRFDGGAVVEFDRPRTVRLSPEPWTDDFQSKARCRTVLIDLLEGPGGEFGEGAVRYVVRPLGE